MRYDFDFIIPAGTLRTDPVKQVVKLADGTLTRFQAYFRAGPHNHVYITLNDALFQVAPANGTQAIFGDNVTQDIPLNYPIKSVGYELQLIGWTDNTRYDHTVTCYLFVDQDDALVKDAFTALTAQLQGGA
jgi:hypothetical protein